MTDAAPFSEDPVADLVSLLDLERNRLGLAALWLAIVLGAVLFCISVAGIFINRKNLIVLLMAIELMLLAVNLLQWWTANRHKNNEPLEVAAAKASGAPA